VERLPRACPREVRLKGTNALAYFRRRRETDSFKSSTSGLPKLSKQRSVEKRHENVIKTSKVKRIVLASIEEDMDEQ
jgi:hypothetical protein